MLYLYYQPHIYRLVSYNIRMLIVSNCLVFTHVLFAGTIPHVAYLESASIAKTACQG